MSPVLEGSLDAKGLRVALVVSRFNDAITRRLLAGAEDCLERHGCGAEQRTVLRVPGAWEIPPVARRVAESGRFDAVVALGALVRGETPHFDVLAAAVARGLGRVGLESRLPVIFGVLTTDTVQQALERAGGKLGNKGWDAAHAAIEMANLYRQLD
jgi:6,7-dimethyl-8-ribityllumazine synthase